MSHTVHEFYIGSDKKPKTIADLPYSYLDNIVKMMDDGRKAKDPEGMYETLKAEMESRPPPEDAPIEERAAPPVRAGAAPIGDNSGSFGQTNDYEIRLIERNASLKNRVAAVVTRANAIGEVKTEAQNTAVIALAKEIQDLEKERKTAYDKEQEDLKPMDQANKRFFLSQGLAGQIAPALKTLADASGAYLAEQDRVRRIEEKRLADLHQAEVDRKALEASQAEAAGRHTEAEVHIEGAMAHEERADQHFQAAEAAPMSYARTSTSAGTATGKSTLEIQSIDNATVDLELLRQFIGDEAIEKAAKAFIKMRGWKGSELVGAKPAKAIKGIVFYEKKSASFR